LQLLLFQRKPDKRLISLSRIQRLRCGLTFSRQMPAMAATSLWLTFGRTAPGLADVRPKASARSSSARATRPLAAGTSAHDAVDVAHRAASSETRWLETWDALGEGWKPRG